MTRLNDGGSSVSHCTRLNQDDALIASASVARLVQDSDIEAEYTIGWVRIFVAAALFIGGFSVSSGVSWLDTVQLPHQPLSVALIAVVAFLALGIASLILAARRWSKPWLAFALVTGDVAILALSLFFGLKVNDLN